MLWNIGSTKIYAPYVGAAGRLLHIKIKVHNGKIETVLTIRFEIYIKV